MSIDIDHPNEDISTSSGGKPTIGGGVALTDYSEVFDVDASVASNALTCTLNERTLNFRSATATSGTATTVDLTSPISVTVSSGSTLGTVNNQSARLVVLAINDSGTIRLGIVNPLGGYQLDESNLVTTTAEGGAGGADSANVIYTTTAVTTPSPYRVVGFIDITEATAGTWATGPTLVQGAGGGATIAALSISQGLTYSDVTGSRAFGTTYYNTTGSVKWVHVRGTSTSPATLGISVDGGDPLYGTAAGAGVTIASPMVPIPPNSTYSATVSAGTGTLARWWEYS